MPRVLEHIDALARQLGRDVFYIRFPCTNELASSDLEGGELREVEELEIEWVDADEEPSECGEGFPEIRSEVLRWLDGEGIPYQDCLGPASDEGFLPWLGEVFLPTALHTPTDPVLRAVNHHLHAADNSSRFPGVALHLLRLETAMKNAHMDSPSYDWD